MIGHRIVLRVLIGVIGFSSAYAASFDILKPTGEKRHCQTSIEKILQDVYHHYPSIKASEKLILSANAQIEGAKWNYFPTPSIDVSQGDGGRRGETYRLDQPLWTGGKLDAMSDLAYARGDEATYTLQESAYELSLRVLNVLSVFIQADGEIKALEKGRKDLEELAGMLSRRVKAGVSSKTDEALVRSRMYQIESDLTSAHRKYEMARSQLSLLAGKKMQCAIGFDRDRYIRAKYTFDGVIKAILKTHPTLKKKHAQIKIVKAEKKSTDAMIMPNVSLRAEHQRGSLYSNDPVNNESIAYIAISFNPGAGLSSLSEMESAKYKMLQAQDELASEEQKLQDTVMQDFSDYLSAKNRLESVKNMINSSETVLESYKRLFLAGKRQWLDLVNQSREVTMNYVTLAGLRASQIIASYRLALDSGKIRFSSEGQ